MHQTPLHVAAKNHNEAMVALLLDHGARIHAKNNWGKTPRDLAEQSAEVKQLLLHWESKTPFRFYLHTIVYIFDYVSELKGLSKILCLLHNDIFYALLMLYISYKMCPAWSSYVGYPNNLKPIENCFFKSLAIFCPWRMKKIGKGVTLYIRPHDKLYFWFVNV